MPTRFILHSANQLRVAQRSKILHIDATGGILRKSIYSKKDSYLFSIVPSINDIPLRCVSVSDFVTERCRVEEIVFWLTNFLCGMNRTSHHRIDHDFEGVIVTDFSWALIHAVLLVFGAYRLDRYLSVVFDSLIKGKPKGGITIFLCSSHVIAQISRKVPAFQQSECKKLFLRAFGNILTAKSLDGALNAWRDLLTVFTSEGLTESVKSAIHRINKVETSLASINEKSETLLDEIIEVSYEDDFISGLRNKSPFKEPFLKVLNEECRQQSFDSIKNKYCNKAAADYLMFNWLPLYGLWGAAVLHVTDFNYLTNARIESWFA